MNVCVCVYLRGSSVFVFTCQERELTKEHLLLHISTFLYVLIKQVHESELVSVNEQLHMQLAEMSILARIKQSEEGGEKDLEGDAMLEKYYEARRELETITQRITSEFEDNIESLKATKRSLEKKVISLIIQL